jgi:hypothetical protein
MGIYISFNFKKFKYFRHLLQQYNDIFLQANRNYFNNLNMIASELRRQMNAVPAYSV